MTVDYTSIKVPKVLAIRIQNEAFPYGYRSVSEFIICSAIQRIINLENK